MYSLCGSQQASNGAYPSASNSVAAGLCTGSLAAAAITSCQSLADLLPVAVQTVRVAFRAGLCVYRAAIAIEPSDDPWSLVIASNSPEDIATRVQSFCESNVSDIHLQVELQIDSLQRLSLLARPFISAFLPHGISVSGSPSSLIQFQRSEQFSKLHAKTIPIFAPYHTSQVFSSADIGGILELPSQAADNLNTERISFISSATGKLCVNTSTRSRLESALTQILLEPIRWHDLARGISASVQASAASEFQIYSFGCNVDTKLAETVHSATGLHQLQSPNPRHTESSSMGWRPDQSKIAIIGFSGRYPHAECNEEFWDLLVKGLDVHEVVPPLHWDAETHVDPTGKRKNTSATGYGCWLQNPAAIDARFFNMSPREAPQVDPAQRLALMTTYEAIEQAGVVPDATPSTYKDRVGLWYGVTSNDWMETNSAQNIDTYFIPGGNRAFIPGRVNYFFKFSGPSYSVDTACSSSLAAIHLACNGLWRGEVDTAIAGGTNILTNPDFTAGLDRGHFLSRTGNCKTFDDDADGYCRGEGVATVILKRLEDAIADNDPIRGLILGAATNHSAEAESITRPHVGAQKDLIANILRRSGVDASEVSYVEMHGTGTQAGDAGEMNSVLHAFAPAVGKPRSQPVYLGSAKSNIGHGEAVSGVSSLAKVLLMMENNLIPPHCGIKGRINRKFPTDLAERNVHIAKAPIPWKQECAPRRVFLNNFSAAGGNTALLLEDAPRESEAEDTDPRTTHLVAVSAKCASSLADNVGGLVAHLEKAKDQPMSVSQLSYTTTARRIHHAHRVMVQGSTISDIQAQLRLAHSRGDGGSRPAFAPEVVFNFTGQGSQFVGMAKQLYLHLPQFRSSLQRLDRLCQALDFPSFFAIIEGGPDEDIRNFSPLIAQLALVCLQIALTKLWSSWGIAPNAVIGHSLGEYAALNAAGVLSDADTIFLVGKRGRLLESRCKPHSHSMLVVKTSLASIKTVLSQMEYEVACINAPAETVLAGPNDKIAALQSHLQQHGLKSKPIAVPYAYHSSQVEAILDDFVAAAHGVVFHKPTIPVISPLIAEVVTTAGMFGAQYLARHCRETVNFLDAMQSAKTASVVNHRSLFIELGPHGVVSGMIRAIFEVSKTIAIPTMQRGRDDWNVLGEACAALYRAGADISWYEYHRPFKSCHKVLRLPAYSWSLKDYWVKYVHDWSLRKGDPPLVTSNRLGESTTIHRVVEETKDTIITECDLAREDLNPLVQGHSVDGIPLCTPVRPSFWHPLIQVSSALANVEFQSVYADIALTIGKYLMSRHQPGTTDGVVNVADMTIQKALIAKPPGPQPLRTIVTIDWAGGSALCQFVSQNVCLSFGMALILRLSWY